jgi:hypothetical protein
VGYLKVSLFSGQLGGGGVRRAAKEVGEDGGTSRCANLENK